MYPEIDDLTWEDLIEQDILEENARAPKRRDLFRESIDTKNWYKPWFFSLNEEAPPWFEDEEMIKQRNNQFDYEMIQFNDW